MLTPRTRDQDDPDHSSTLSEPQRRYGDYGYLGYPPETPSVAYGPLVRKIPSLLKLVRVAHGLRRCAGEVACSAASMTCLELERARENRRRVNMDRGIVAFSTALEGVGQRMGKLSCWSTDY